MSHRPDYGVRFVFGAMTIGAPGTDGIRVTTLENAKQLLDVFQQHGHTEVDTARIYGGGTSEEYLGALEWQARGIKISTKLYPTKGKPFGWLFPEELTHSPVDLRKALMDSLAALKSNTVDTLFLHAPDRSIPFEDTVRELNQMHAEGLFSRLGLSNYQAWEVAQICEICIGRGWIVPRVYQGIYNALHRAVEPELITCLRHYHISFEAYQPLGGGFLSGRYTPAHATFSAEEVRFDPSAGVYAAMHRQLYWNEPHFAALELLKPVLQRHGISASEAALRWLTHHSALRADRGDGVVVGASTQVHLEENLEAFKKGPLPDDVVAALDAGWALTRVLPLTYWQ